MAKLWDKGVSVDSEIETYTVGNDYLVDLELIPYDCDASSAHAMMLQKCGFLTKDELKKLQTGLLEIKKLHADGKFTIDPHDEDGHTAIEKYLTEKYGDAGKKIHTARSRNDQSMTALRLYMKDHLSSAEEQLTLLSKALKAAAAKYNNVPMPGYTHMQRAMPSSVSLWLSAFYDAVQDDLTLVKNTKALIDQNPLGSAAGYGLPIKIDRKLTTKLMGFAKTQENPIYCGNSRGKFESNVMNTLTQIMVDLNKLATDLMLFSTTEFNFMKLPEKYCTGSSIMPQKQNPDVLELMRAKYHLVVGYQMEILGMIGSLPSGYNRDFQLTKEPMMRSFAVTLSSVSIMTKIIAGLQVNTDALKNAMSPELYATEKAYRLVEKGMSFRDAYRQVGEELKKNK